MAAVSSLSHVGCVLRLANLLWYLLLSPLFLVYILLHASGVKFWILHGYQCVLDCTRVAKPIVAGKQGLDFVAGAGCLPLTVCLGLVYTPFYLYSMVWWQTSDFFLWHMPLMFFFALICSEDTHYDSHYWLTRRHQHVWYRRVVSGRFKQYTQMIWYPITQHLPHLHNHHKFNMKNQHDVDYVGCYRRDAIADFLCFASGYEWNYIGTAFRYFSTLTSKSLLKAFTKDCLLHYGLLALAACCGWQKFVFQHAWHCLCYFFIAWVTFFVEHPFHHTVNNSYDHFWNVLTVVDSKTGRCSESHTAHHIWPAQAIQDNAAWANNPLQFATSQLKNKHLAVACSGAFEELLYMPYLMITKQYSRLVQMLHFKEPDQLNAAGMTPDLIDAYQLFRKQCDEHEIKRRLQPRNHCS